MHLSLDRMLDEPDAPDVREHLEACAACRAELKQFLAVQGASETAEWDGSTGPTADPPERDGPLLSAGDRVGPYVVERELGRGGLARVYKVRHTLLDKARALKVVQVTGPGLRRRVILEGQAMASLEHPGIVRVLDVLDVHGHAALVMDLVEGGSLQDWLAEHRPTTTEALVLFRELVVAVTAAHEQGFVHRDLKPANVLLAFDGAGRPRPRVADFGLAKAVAPDEHSLMTHTGAVMGTLQYMAPEQLRDSSRVDVRADLFSLGCILYELVCGRRAFTARDTIEMYKLTSSAGYEPPEAHVPDLPLEVGALIRALLCPNREGRPASGGVVLGQLDAVGEPGDYKATPLGVAPPPPADTWAPLSLLEEPAETPMPPAPPVEVAAAPVVPVSTQPVSTSRLRWVWLLVALTVPAMIAFTQLLDPADLALQTPILRAARGVVGADDVLVVAIEDRKDLPARRAEHGALIDALVAADARVVVLDLAMSTHKDGDAELLAAIGRAEAAGVPVVLPVRIHRKEVIPPNPALAAATTTGMVELGHDLVFGVVRYVRVRRRDMSGASVWHIAAEAARQHQRAEAIEWVDGELRIGALRNPAARERLVLPSVEDPPVVSYDDRGALEQAAGRVVIVGVLYTEDRKRTPDGSRYGVEVLATAVQTLLRQAGVRRALPEFAVLLTWVGAGATMGLLWWLPGRARVLTAIVPATLVAFAVALALGGTILSVLPALLAYGLALRAVRAPSGA